MRLGQQDGRSQDEQGGHRFGDAVQKRRDRIRTGHGMASLSERRRDSLGALDRWAPDGLDTCSVHRLRASSTRTARHMSKDCAECIDFGRQCDACRPSTCRLKGGDRPAAATGSSRIGLDVPMVRRILCFSRRMNLGQGLDGRHWCRRAWMAQGVCLVRRCSVGARPVMPSQFRRCPGQVAPGAFRLVRVSAAN